MTKNNRETSPFRLRIKALSYALIYVALAGLWILLSGVAIDMFAGHAAIRGDLEMLKGILFVLLTGWALYALLRAWQSEIPEVQDTLIEEEKRRIGGVTIRLPVIYLLGFLLIIACGSYVVFEHLKRSELKKIEQNLAAVATLKAEQINSWLKHNLNFAVAAGNHSYLASSVEEWARRGTLPSQRMAWVQRRLETLQQSQGYGDLSLYDLQGKQFLGSKESVAGDAGQIAELLQRAIKARAPVIGIMHWHQRPDGTKYVSLPMAAPLMPAGAKGPVVGGLIFELSPQAHILPLIETWPTPSKTAETIVFMRDGDSVVYLNALRHREASLLSKSSILANPNLLETQIVGGASGFIEGTDYRGEPVVGYAVNIPNTDWFMLTEADKEEVEQPIRKMAANVAAAALLLALVGSLSLYFWWRQRRAKYETERVKAALQQEALGKQVDFLSKYANDAMFLTNEVGIIVDANDRAETMYGYPRAVLLGMNVKALRAQGEAFDIDRLRQKILEQKNMLVESVHRRSDGSVFPVEVSMGLIQAEHGFFAQGIVRDISERKQSEMALRASETRMSLLFNNMTNGFALHEVIRNAQGKAVDFRYLEANPAFEKIVHMHRGVIVGKTIKELFPSTEACWIESLGEVATTNEPRHMEGYVSAWDGWFSVYAFAPAPGQVASLVEDVTTRKMAEQRAQRLVNLYRALSETNDAIVRLEDQSALFPMACRIAVELGGMRFAWVGVADTASGRIVPIASHGDIAGYLDGIKIALSPDEPEGLGPTSITLRDSRVVVINDFDADHQTAPWHDRAKRHGVRSSATLPIIRNGKPYAVFSVYSDQSQAFDEEFVGLLGEISANLGFALENFDRETLRRQTEVALRQSEARLRRVAEEAPYPMMVFGEDGGVFQINRAWMELSGYTLTDIPTISVWAERAFGSKAREAEMRIRGVFAAEQRFDSGEQMIRCKNGQFRTWHIVSSPLGRLPDERRYAITMATDITESKQSEEGLRLAATVFESNHSAIVITDDKANIVTVNPAFTRITGYTEAEVLGRNPSLLQSGRQTSEFYQAFWNTLLQEDGWQGEVWNCRKNGEEYAAWLSVSAMRDENGVTRHYIGIADDITENKEIQKRIEYLAYHDFLTGLPNRMLANDRLEQAIAHAHRVKSRVAVMFLDLDDFKVINDTLGHAVGDSILKVVAERLLECVRESDTVSRLGGDEFLVMLNDVTEIEDINRVALNILESVNQTYPIAEHNLIISTSIGIALYPEDGQDRGTLLKNADMAMYNAKQSGRNTHRFFAEEMNDYVLEHLLIRNGLSRALENREFQLHFQPLLELSTGRLMGAEALIRWRHPELGMIPPNRFIQVAEDSGMIIPIGNWVLQEACQQAVRWHQAGWPELVVAVNISALQFRRGDIEETVSLALAQSGLASRFLELELTESILIQDFEKTLDVLERLGQLGVHLSIDDFGTGYSSLGYLRRLPVDKLKIDQSFVREITTREDDAAITLSIITLAHSLKKRVVAEGVETVEQLRFLQENRCDEMQGYLFSRPLPSDAFCDFLRKGGRPDFLQELG